MNKIMRLEGLLTISVMTGMIEEIRIHSQLILMAILKLHMDLLYRLETPFQMQHTQMAIVRAKIGMVIG